MKILFLAIILFTAFASAQAQPLRVVNVNAPAINCLFDPSCRVTVNDTSNNIPLAAGGTNFLQTRTFKGRKGSPAVGLYVYEYRLDLRNAVGLVAIPCLSSLTINFGPVVDALDFDGDGKGRDQVFVVTRGGLGSIGLASAEKTGAKITFEFSAPVCAGGRPGGGQSSFFFGLVSANPPKLSTATILESGGAKYEAQVRVPASDLADRLQNPLNRRPRPFEPPRLPTPRAGGEKNVKKYE